MIGGLSRKLTTTLLALGVLAASSTAVLTVTQQEAKADDCYTWTRTLSAGASGDDVAQLQIRVGGFAAYHDPVGIDGSYGPETQDAVARFQTAHGLGSDGVAGPATFDKIYELQDSDCTPAHFAWSEFASCQGGFDGGAVGASTVQNNLFRVMWRLEGLRHKLGGLPLSIASGFRSYACNGGASNSQHLYGTASDVVGPSGMNETELCNIARTARDAGFSGIIGPGDPDHNDHIHLDLRLENPDDGIADGFYWYAPNCIDFPRHPGPVQHDH